MAFTMGPATEAPWVDSGWNGTTTAMATFGSLAGANPIIQSATEVITGKPTWAVPVFTATSREDGNPSPRAVPEVATDCINGVTSAAALADMACFQIRGW